MLLYILLVISYFYDKFVCLMCITSCDIILVNTVQFSSNPFHFNLYQPPKNISKIGVLEKQKNKIPLNAPYSFNFFKVKRKYLLYPKLNHPRIPRIPKRVRLPIIPLRDENPRDIYILRKFVSKPIWV